MSHGLDGFLNKDLERIIEKYGKNEETEIGVLDLSDIDGPSNPYHCGEEENESDETSDDEEYDLTLENDDYDEGEEENESDETSDDEEYDLTLENDDYDEGEEENESDETSDDEEYDLTLENDDCSTSSFNLKIPKPHKESISKELSVKIKQSSTAKSRSASARSKQDKKSMVQDDENEFDSEDEFSIKDEQQTHSKLTWSTSKFEIDEDSDSDFEDCLSSCPDDSSTKQSSLFNRQNINMQNIDEDGWEDQYVFVELVGLLDPDKLSFCTAENTAILGVDNEITVLKLGGYTFAGSYEDSLGTMVLFEEHEEKNKKSLKYHSHTTKVLKTSRVFLKPKEQEVNNQSCALPSVGLPEKLSTESEKQK